MSNQESTSETNREMKVRIPERQYLKLHALKITRGLGISEAVSAALDAFLEEIEAEEGDLLEPVHDLFG
ncbi:MAG: hypothetical protein R3185_05450 [Candidatus Thermoplasmatota archaeon]|nr:hypothetical protein [Candidatus Thermoplasmatota archaeon]